MLYFIAAWLLLCVVCSLTGIVCLTLLERLLPEKDSQSIFLAPYLGIGILCVIFTTLALFFPLSPFIAPIVYAGIAGFLTLHTKTRTQLLRILSRLGPPEIAYCIASAVILAFILNRQIDWFDTGSYHLGSIRWLNDFGAVPGVALINTHFGKTSSWFALSASLIPNILTNHIGAVTNGFIFLLVILQLGITSIQSSKRSIDAVDYFSIIFLFLIVINYTILQPQLTAEGMSILNSFSPDVSINILVGIVVWAVLIDFTRSSSRLESEKRDRTLDSRLIPLILSAAAFTIKITALPLLVVSSLFYISKNAYQIKRWLLACSLIACFLLPSILLSIISSGCPLFPSRIMCLDVSWLIPASRSLSELELIVQGAATSNNLFQKWFYLIPTSPKLFIMFFLLLFSLVLGIRSLLRVSHSVRQPDLWVSSFSMFGILFMLIVSHDNILRFGLSYFLISPCWITANFLAYGFRLNLLRRLLERSPFLNNLSSHGNYTFTLLIMLVLIFSNLHAKDSGSVISILPPALPQPNIVEYQLSGADFFYADFFRPENQRLSEDTHEKLDGLCWYSRLPCIYSRKEDIALRNLEKGIPSGFRVKSDLD